MRHFFIACALVAVVGCARKEPPVVAVQPEPAPIVVVPLPPTPTPEPDDSIPPPRVVPVRSRFDALARGASYLLTQQSADGAWRSDVYATFKDGTALTPLAIVALQEARDAGILHETYEHAIRQGCKFLGIQLDHAKGIVSPLGDGLDYPVYTAALAVKALSHPTAKDFVKHRDAWVKYLKERQLTEKLGWKPDEKQYGGWGYCRVIPQKPEPGKFAPTLIESNLSATVFVLDALKAADALDADTAKAAAIFVRTCQNWQPPIPGPPAAWFKYVDGGFHFIYDDPTRNKAGMVPKEGADWPQLFYSYGSTTADGLQALALCNDPADKERREAARKWLIANFHADSHPGTYIKTHEANRDAVYFYYAASVARTFRDHKLQLPDSRDWSAELSKELARRQAKDGSWSNPIELVRENDPIVATSNAVLALARCGK